MNETKQAIIRAILLVGCGYQIANEYHRDGFQWLSLFTGSILIFVLLWQYTAAVDSDRKREQLYDLVRPPHEQQRGQST